MKRGILKLWSGRGCLVVVYAVYFIVIIISLKISIYKNFQGPADAGPFLVP